MVATKLQWSLSRSIFSRRSLLVLLCCSRRRLRQPGLRLVIIIPVFICRVSCLLTLTLFQMQMLCGVPYKQQAIHSSASLIMLDLSYMFLIAISLTLPVIFLRSRGFFSN